MAFLTSYGPLDRVGIEGTSSYGAGIAAAAAAAGLVVLEVSRPNRADRRRRGKSDPLDAYNAARAALAKEDLSAPKSPAIEAIRSLQNTRRSAVKARTATINLITSTLISAPDTIRARYRALKDKALIAALIRARPATVQDPVEIAVLTALKTLARRYRFLDEQARDLSSDLDDLVTTANPALRAAHGVGPDTAAQLLITAGANPDRLGTEATFAALCGVAPVPASSGKTTRHRLSRGGDRGANSALYRIALVRMSSHGPTRAYTARHKAAGRPVKDILRMLKRAIAREIHRLLTTAIPIPTYTDLRPARQAKNLTLTAAAQHFAVWPTVISRIERGLQRHDELATAYRLWLAAA